MQLFLFLQKNNEKLRESLCVQQKYTTFAPENKT